MNNVIYADTLIFINIFVTYFLLLTTDFLCKTEISRTRILLSSIIGGFYSLTMLIPSILPFISILFRIVMCVLLCRISAVYIGVRPFLKRCFVFLCVNFVFAGIMFAIQSLPIPGPILFENGAIYFNISVPLVLLFTVLAYGIVRFCLSLSNGHDSNIHYGKIEIRCGIQSVKGNGIFDTGHHLTDRFTGKPVIIAQYSFIEPLLPTEILQFLKGKSQSECHIPPQWEGKLRLFPYSSIGGNGLLPAFRADEITISHLDMQIKKNNIYIAVSPNAICTGEYNVLFPCSLYDEIQERGIYYEKHSDFRKGSVSSHIWSIHGKIHPLYQWAANTSTTLKKERGGRNHRTLAKRR